MIKTIYRPELVFDTDMIPVGSKIRYTFYHYDGWIYDTGFGKIEGVNQYQMFIDYYSESEHIDKFIIIYPQDLQSNIHKVEIIESNPDTEENNE